MKEDDREQEAIIWLIGISPSPAASYMQPIKSDTAPLNSKLTFFNFFFIYKETKL